MDDSRPWSEQLAPSQNQMPSSSSLSSHVDESTRAAHGHRASTHDYSGDNTSALIEQIQSRDRTIAILRVELERLQTLCEQLEIKARVMDREHVNLKNEILDLKTQTSLLAKQVEKLTQEKDHLYSQSQADAAQWRQIVDMSSRLQLQSVEETRRFNADRESWRKERDRLEEQLNELQDGTPRRTPVEDSVNASSDLTSLSDERVREEVSVLRERCTELEELLGSVLKESASIERTDTLMKEVRRRIVPGKDSK